MCQIDFCVECLAEIGTNALQGEIIHLVAQEFYVTFSKAV